MKTRLQFVLDREDIGQILDALDVRIEAWELTLNYLRGGNVGDGLIEECSDKDEAAFVAEKYRKIAADIRSQMDGQK